MTPEEQLSGLEAEQKILLYYPTIDIPSPGWIRQGLMYWDKIGSIVPESYDEQLPQHLRYSAQIQPIYDANLFRPYNPADFFMKNWRPSAFEEFRQELLQTLGSRDFLQQLPESANRQFRSEVYSEKINDLLFQELKSLNLVSERQGDMVYFEKKAALVYMAVLAKHLADNDIQYTIPSTDLIEYERLNFQTRHNKATIIPCLQVNFRDLLRVPTNDVEIERIIDFRLTHNAELLNFRYQVLDKFQDELQKAGDKNEIKDKAIRFKSQINKGVRDLDLLLKEAKFQTVTGSMKTIFKPQHIDKALTAAMAGGATSGSITTAAICGITGLLAGGATSGSITTAAICGITGLLAGASVEILDFLVSKKNAKREKLASNTYSYLYLAEKKFSRIRQRHK